MVEHNNDGGRWLQYYAKRGLISAPFLGPQFSWLRLGCCLYQHGGDMAQFFSSYTYNTQLYQFGFFRLVVFNGGGVMY